MIELTTEDTRLPFCYKLPDKIKQIFISCKSFDDLYFTLNHNSTSLYTGGPNFLCNDLNFSSYTNNSETRIISSQIHTLYDHTIDALLPETNNYLIIMNSNIYNIWATLCEEKNYPKRKDIAYRQYNIKNQSSLLRLPLKAYLRIDNLHSNILLYDNRQNTKTLNSDVLYYYNQYTNDSKKNWYFLNDNFSFIKSDGFELIEEYYMKIK